MVNWVKSTEFYNNPENSFYPIAIFFNSYNDPNVYPNIPNGLTMGTWTVVDLKPYGVAEDAKWAMLAGILLITGAGEIQLAMRAPGSSTVPSGAYYDQQLLNVDPQGGQRSVGFNMVPLVNGCFEVLITGNRYPLGAPLAVGQVPCVGCNLKVEAWGR